MCFFIPAVIKLKQWFLSGGGGGGVNKFPGERKPFSTESLINKFTKQYIRFCNY